MTLDLIYNQLTNKKDVRSVKMLIKLSEYAKRNNKSVSTVKDRIYQGDIPATKIGNLYYIDSEFPYPDDKRIKHGEYIDIRKRIKQKEE